MNRIQTIDQTQLSLRLNTFRHRLSPYLDKYRTDETLFAIYCNRFYPINNGEDVLEYYWKLRRGVLMYDVPEMPLTIEGPDAVALLERVFTCPVASLKVWRARYGIACTEEGTVLMDGVLIRLAEDRFWYVKANGEFLSWLKALAIGLDVRIGDPRSRVLQIQGPRSLEVLDAAIGGGLPDTFRYFHAGMFDMGGQELLVTRTGWTGEIGIEIYSNSSAKPTDHDALWDHLLASGAPFGLEFASGVSMSVRRIEAGILDNGTDMEPDMTPFAAGLGSFVDMGKADFIGKRALESADRTPLLLGVVCETAVPVAGMKILKEDRVAGKIQIGTWSPTLEKGIGYVRFLAPFDGEGGWIGQSVTLRDNEGKRHPCSVVTLPFFDAEKRIPRGLS